jgi:hypothetical protein
MPAISQIPDANTLHAQLDAVNDAIASLGSGATVTHMTISSPPVVDPEPPVPPAMGDTPPPPPVFNPPTTIVLEPPISDPETIAVLTQALQMRADTITQQLVAQGYTDDVQQSRSSRSRSAFQS